MVKSSATIKIIFNKFLNKEIKNMLTYTDKNFLELKSEIYQEGEHIYLQVLPSFTCTSKTHAVNFIVEREEKKL